MTQCKRCGAEIKFIQLTSGKWNPVDPEAIHFNECEKREILVMEDGEIFTVNPEHNYPQDESYGYISHFATCPAAKEFRK